MPRTECISTVNDLRALDGKEAFPWVLKADGTWGGGGVRIAQTRVEAEQSFVELRRTFVFKRVIKRLAVNRDSFWVRPWWNHVKPAVVVQSHVQGRPANCAVLCLQGTVLAVIGVEVVSADGLTGPANVVRVVDNAEMNFAAERIASRLGLSGFFGLDFMIDESGAAHLIEMNPRATPLCHLRLGKGRDMIGALEALLLSQPLQEAPSITENDRIAYFPQAWAAGRELLDGCFQDIPISEPALVQELLHPWPDRSLLFRGMNRLQRMKSFAVKQPPSADRGHMIK